MRNVLILLLTLLCTSSLLAEPDQSQVHVLYSLHADVDADGVPERLVVVAYTKADPTQPGDKAFWVLKLAGDQYKKVYDSGPSEGAFSNEMQMWQVLSPASVPPGISVTQDGKRYPQIRLCFTPNSDHLIDYRFDGKNFVVEYPAEL